MKYNVRKLTIAGVLSAVAVVGSFVQFPVMGSKCAPVQHMVNIICAVLVGPAYGLAAAFVTSVIRNLLGIGSLMAFPGSMFGVLLAGLMYKKSKSITLTALAEVFGTAILGGLCAYPIFVFLMGKDASKITYYFFIIPFFISTAAGSLISFGLLTALNKTGTLGRLQDNLNEVEGKNVYRVS